MSLELEIRGLTPHGYVYPTHPPIYHGNVVFFLTFSLTQAALESNGQISDTTALALVTVNLEKALGINSDRLNDIVVYRGGGPLELTSKVVGVISATRKVVDVF